MNLKASSTQATQMITSDQQQHRRLNQYQAPISELDQAVSSITGKKIKMMKVVITENCNVKNILQVSKWNQWRRSIRSIALF